MTSVIGLPSTCLACPVNLVNMEVGSGFRVPEIRLHLLWTHLKQPPQKHRGLCRIFLSISSCSPDIRALVLPMLTWSPLPSMLDFQRISFSWSSPSDSEMRTRSFAYRFFKGNNVQNSWKMASRTMTDSRRLRQKAWWTPTFTLNSSLRLQSTRTLLLAFSYMFCMRRTGHSFIPSLQRAHQVKRIDNGHAQCLIDGMELFE